MDKTSIIHEPMGKNRLSTFLLLLGTSFWGMTFVLVKEGISIIDVHTFLAWRFMIAAGILFIFFIGRFRKTNLSIIKYGILLGIVLWMGYAMQTIGLQYTSASKAAFITGLSVVLVPLILSLFESRVPSVNQIIAVILATCGLGLMTLTSSFEVNRGDVWIFFCAICFAVYIILVGKYTHIFESIQFTVIQLSTVAVLSGIISVAFHDLSVPKGYMIWQAIIFCSIFATAFMYAIQNEFQKYLSEVKTAIIFSFEPLFAALTAYLYLHETMTIRILFGGFLIFLAMLVSELRRKKMTNEFFA